MTSKKLPGKLISGSRSGSCLGKKIVTFEQIYYLNDKFHKPTYQGSLDQDKVNEMVLSYVKNPSFLRAKDNITIGVINNSYYIIDGQHRFELAKKLFQEKDTKDYLIFTYFECKSKTDAISLFEELNKDSIKNKLYINSDIFTKIKINELKQLFKSFNSDFFAKRKSKNGRRYTIEEFVEKLVEVNYIGNKSAKDIYSDIKKKNNEFYKKCSYESDLKHNINIFCKRDLYNIENKHIYSLKHNNFIIYVKNKDIIPYHEKRKFKKKITRKIRNSVWKKEFNTSLEGKCPIKNCLTTLTFKNFACGHITAEANGGENTVDNLRPICNSCNSSMGTTNWENYT